MTSQELETLRVNSVSALLALVPYVLRHRPTAGTAVLMVFNPQGTFVVGVRGALDDLDEPTFVDTALKGVRQAGGSHVVAVAYGRDLDDETAAQIQGFVWDLEAASMSPAFSGSSAGPEGQDAVVSAAGLVEVLDLIQVGFERDSWRSVINTEQLGEQHSYSHAMGHSLATEMVLRGYRPAENRDQLVESLRPGSEQPSREFHRGLVRGRHLAETYLRDLDGLAWFRTELRSQLDLVERLTSLDPEPEHREGVERGPGSAAHVRPSTDREVGLLVGLCTHPAAVDDVLVRLTHATAQTQLELWSSCARRVTGTDAVTPLVVAGLAGWVSGGGTLLNAAYDHAVLIDPDNPRVQVMARVAGAALPPAAWEPLRQKLER